MDNEATRLINEKIDKNEQPKAAESQTKSRKGASAAAAAGGFAVGGAMGVGATAMASNNAGETAVDAKPEENFAPEQEAPAPEEAILANDEGIRYAHVDASSFGEAFAQARAQVGPGGVFEYEGRLYGTYYADEWNEMSAQERADYQNRVNEISPSHSTNSMAAGNGDAIEVSVEEVPADASMVAGEPVDNEIHVIGVETIETPDGTMNWAYLENDGQIAAMVDVDGDGRMDVLVADLDGDGVISDGEMAELPTDVEINYSDLEQMHHAQNGDLLYTSYDDGMNDYINDADSIMTV